MEGPAIEISFQIYYEDELNDEFSEAKIEPRKIDGNYTWYN